MSKNLLARGAAAFAAAVTTFVLFHAVAALGDEDRAMLLAAQHKPFAVAASNTTAVR